ncbi:MAG: DUF302 domain-containing protein [Alphaproteobacteria bacterium]|nr:DUF302 domain-containing protein [Alphaproteobacteria bacterium]
MPLTRNLVKVFGLLACLALLPQSGHADQGFPYDGMQIIDCQKNFKALFNDLDAAVRKHRMGVVGRASASMGAAGRGIEIPGNAVFGVFRNDFAVRMLRASIPAGIEAPLRFYITENDDGTSQLSYRRPTAVFKSYGNAALDVMAAELDVIFSNIAKDAAAN